MRSAWRRRLIALNRLWSHPNPLLDAAWYLATYPDVREAGYEPHQHYRRHGAFEGRDPNPLFSTDWYLRQYPDVAAGGWDPLDHYLAKGASEGRDPSPLFDTDWYLEQYPDVRETHLNPLVHYLRYGAAEGRMPRAGASHDEGRPSSHRGLKVPPPDPRHRPTLRSRLRGVMFGRSAAPDAMSLEQVYFDPSFYLRRYPDVALSGLAPYEHYRATGVHESRLPNDFFHVAGYVHDNPDVAAYGGNVVTHYATIGRLRGATPHPLFDPGWYAGHHPDVGATQSDAYAHYLTVGRREGRRTSAAVDVGFVPDDEPLAFTQPERARTTVIVPAFGRFADTYRCLYALAHRSKSPGGVRIIVADDRPEQPLGPLLAEIAGLEVITNQHNLGYLRNCNNAAQLARGEYIVFLNNDAVVEPGWLAALAGLADRDPAVALVGSMLLRPDGRLEEAGGVMFRDGRGHPYGQGDDPGKPEYNFVRDVDCLRGACLLVRRSVFEAVGRFDERYAPAFFEEFDLAFKVRAAGHRVVYQPASRVHHAGSGTYGRGVRGALTAANHQKFVKRWSTTLAARPPAGSDVFVAREAEHRRGAIVIVDDHVPEYDRSAGGRAIWDYIQLLREEDFKVAFVAHDGDLAEPYTSTLQQRGAEVVRGPAEARRWLRAYGSHVRWVMCARPGVAPAYIRLVRTTTKARLLYFTHDLHFLRELRHAEIDARPRVRQRAERLRQQELGIVRSVDAVLTPSSAEARLLGELAPKAKVFVIPLLIVRPDELPPVAGLHHEQRQAAIFVAGFRHQPNVDAAVFLVRELMPMVWESVPDARLLIVGSDPTPEVLDLAGPLVEVTGYVPDLAPFYAQARLSINPLRYGAGVKGKIIESLAAGVPVVTTSIGNEGLDLTDGVDVMVADDPAGLARAAVALLQDAALATRIAQAGLRTVGAKFSPQVARRALIQALDLPMAESGS